MHALHPKQTKNQCQWLPCGTEDIAWNGPLLSSHIRIKTPQGFCCESTGTTPWKKKTFQQIPAKPRTQQFSQWVHGLTCKNIMDSVRCSTSGWPVNCRTIGLNARERPENLQLLSPQVSTGLWMRENGANHCQALAAKERKWAESQHLPLMRLECTPCSH